MAATKVRTTVAQAVWAVCVLAALTLAVATLCIALKADPGNGAVRLLLRSADALDLGVFSRGGEGPAHFKGHTHAAETKNALVDWGLASVVWLVVGGTGRRVLRPRRAPAGASRPTDP